MRTSLIDHLIHLTSLRNREEMDLCLVHAVRERARARQVAISRMLGDAGDERWFTSTEIGPNGEQQSADASWVDLQDLPPLSSQPEWLECASRACELARPSGDPADPATVTLFPLRATTGVVGVVRIESALPLDEAARADARGLIEIYRNLVSTLDYTESDTLTGLLNRKSFDDSFYKASALPLSPLGAADLERRQAREQRYWLGVVDIDHFKQVNDQHGHLIGDEVLLLMSRVMRQSFRFLDKLYRFGGEEFVVLLRCPTEDEALAVLERFRQQVEAYPFPRVQHVTVSVGFTDVRSGDTPPAAVERADLAVYYAKHHGRNQVRSHAALVRDGALSDAVQTSDVEFF